MAETRACHIEFGINHKMTNGTATTLSESGSPHKNKLASPLSSEALSFLGIPAYSILPTSLLLRSGKPAVHGKEHTYLQGILSGREMGEFCPVRSPSLQSPGNPCVGLRACAAAVSGEWAGPVVGGGWRGPGAGCTCGRGRCVTDR